MKKLLLGTVFSAFVSTAFAADIPGPVYKAPPAAVVSANGFYFSVDGAWQHINLPDAALGFHLLKSGSLTDAGTLSLPQRLDGYQFHGRVGYFLPAGYSNSIFGADTRLELGGLFGHASGTAGGTISSAGPNGGVVRQNLDGSGANGGYACIPGQVCTINGNSSANYSDWQIDGKIAGDYRVGVVRVTPSLAVFGGNVHNDQTMAQVLALSVTPLRASYNASTSMRWTDFGARAGLDLQVDVSPRTAVGFSGWAGFADRHVSLSGSDVFTDNIPGFF